MAFESPWKELHVPQGGTRVDVWLAANVPGLSRREAAKLLATGDVTVNGRRVRKSEVLDAGQSVAITRAPTPQDWTVKPVETLPLEVIHEDPAFVVLNKPSGMPSTAISFDDESAVANAVAAAYPECIEIGRPGDAGLIHRLDTVTSGLLIAARTHQAFNTLRLMQDNSQVEKEYAALVAGIVDVPRTISVRLASKGKGGKKVVPCNDGVNAVTHLTGGTVHGGYSLLDVLIYKGFRHQIRVHLAQAGYPICGDKLYDGPSLPGLNRLFLHATALRFEHPEKGVTVEVKCPLPAGLKQVLPQGYGPGAHDEPDQNSQ